MGKKRRGVYRGRRNQPDVPFVELPAATFSSLSPLSTSASAGVADAVSSAFTSIADSLKIVPPPLRSDSATTASCDSDEGYIALKDNIDLAPGVNMPLPVGYFNGVEYQEKAVFGTDENIEIACDNAKTCGYNFLCYPIAGMRRAAEHRRTDFDEQAPECLDVAELAPPHVVLHEHNVRQARTANELYGYISPWVNCDHPNEKFAKYSMEQMFGYELPNAEYLGVRTVVIEIRRRDNPNLLRMLREWCWRRATNLRFWIIYPSTLSEIEGAKPTDEIWQLWSDFRGQLHNFGRSKLCCGIKFVASVDDEFKIQKKAKRWRGEAIELFWYDSSVLRAFSEIDDNDSNFLLRMPSDYTSLMLYVYHNNEQKCMISGTCSSPIYMAGSVRLLDSIRYVVLQIVRSFGIVRNLVPHMEDYGIDFSQHLQTPLRPAEDLLSKAVYQTFENSVEKYEVYFSAILAALTDLFDEQICTQSKTPVVLIVGAGRGGLVKEVMRAQKQLEEIYNTKQWTVIALERNPFAANVLQQKTNRKEWGFPVLVIKADARDSELLTRLLPRNVNLVVSEMLGSFGCNELCPEVLRNIELNHCDEHTIFIPYKYVNFVEPMFSMNLLDAVRCQQPNFYNRFSSQKSRQPDETATCSADRMYVIAMNHYYRVALPLPCIEFSHPDPLCPIGRNAVTRFNVDYAADVSGFAGYFFVHLYKDINFTTIPSRMKSAAMSWFPMFIPLRYPIRCPEGSTLTFQISRRAESDGSWYEWNAVVTKDGEKIEETPIQNEYGRFDFMKLPSLEADDVNYDDSSFLADSVDRYVCEYS